MQQSLRDFLRYVSLNVMGMLGLSCYILADTFFVARGLGSQGLAALNLAIPVYSLIHGCGLMLGMGGATRYTILRHQGREREGDAVFTHTLVLAFALMLAFLALGIGAADPIARWLGADETVLDMSRTYLQVLLLFSPAFLLNDVLLCFVRNDGAPQLSMVAMIVGSLSNVALDYIFIFPMQMGIFGAVLATGLAPIISLAVLSPFFFQRKHSFRPVRCRASAAMAASIVGCGLPSWVTEVSSGVVMILFNAIILRLQGNIGVAAYGVVANLSLVVIAIYTGIAQGMQPLVSRSFGQGRPDEVRRLMRYGMTMTLGISAALYILIATGAGPIAAAFNGEGNPALQAMAEAGMRLYFLGGPFAGVNILLCVYFTCTDRARPAQVIAILRGFAVLAPSALLFSGIWGMTGLWLAFPAAEAAVMAAALLWYRRRGAHPLPMDVSAGV